MLLVVTSLPASAQNAKREALPEVNLYVNQGSRIRLLSQYSMNEDRQGGDSAGNFAYYFEFALRPVFRRQLWQQTDVFRRRYLTFRAGYRYTTTLTSGDSSSEHRAVTELTSRYPLPRGIVIADRSRGDFRFVKGQPFSTRYRNRLWVERDIKRGWLALTPYVYDEVFFDSRYHAWTKNRLVFGLQVPAGVHLVVEPYFQNEINSRSTPRRTVAIGLTLSLYF
jgi:hypothetical protein